MNHDDLATLGALSVAHDALLEGRDAATVMADSPLWARVDRLLPSGGWAWRTFEEILSEIRESMREAYGPSIDLSESSTMGHLAAVYAAQVADEQALLKLT